MQISGSGRVDFMYKQPKALSLVGVDPNTGGPKTSKSKIKQTIKKVTDLSVPASVKSSTLSSVGTGGALGHF